MTRLLLFVEGGNSDEAARLRESWRLFFGEIDGLCRQRQVGFEVKPGGSIDRTFEIFRRECQKYDPKKRCLLLVDADGAIPAEACPKVFLSKGHPAWELPSDKGPEVYHCMVQTFEAWLLADQAAALNHFGCNPGLLPDERSVDGLSKKKLGEILDAACRHRKDAPKYHKLRDGAALLKKIDPAKVQAHSPHCRRLFENLRAALAA